MNTHELTDALSSVDVELPADLLVRVRAGGERRQRRRTLHRLAAVAGGTAVALVAVPVFAELAAASRPASPATLSPAAPTQAAVPSPTPVAASTGDWRSRWPLPATDANCGGGFGAKGTPGQFPDLLLLPAGKVDSAYVRDNLTDCPRPHVALLLQRRGSSTHAGLAITGPNAPTPAETGAFGPVSAMPSSNPDPDPLLTRRTGHEPIQGRPAFSSTYELSDGKGGEIFWTTADGGQWEASIDGLGWQEAQALLNGLTMDAAAGTGSLNAGTAAAWSVVPTPPDRADSRPPVKGYGGDWGALDAAWSDAGLDAQLTVNQGSETGLTPLRLACCSTEEVDGHPAEFLEAPVGGAVLTWSPTPGDYAELFLDKGTHADALRIARGLTAVSPGDPRIHEPSNDPSPFPTP